MQNVCKDLQIFKRMDVLGLANLQQPLNLQHTNPSFSQVKSLFYSKQKIHQFDCLQNPGIFLHPFPVCSTQQSLIKLQGIQQIVKLPILFLPTTPTHQRWEVSKRRKPQITHQKFRGFVFLFDLRCLFGG